MVAFICTKCKREYSTGWPYGQCPYCEVDRLQLRDRLLTDRLAAIKRFVEGVDVDIAATWQPMATAPRDGTEVLLCVERRAGVPGCMLVGHYMPGGHCIEDHPPIDEDWYFWTGGMFDTASKPICWMPLPEAAEAEEEGE